MGRVLRPTREQIDNGIVDLAAALFARHGFKQTSVQAVADAAGYSKAGLLSHFPSKELLQDAVVEHCVEGAEKVVEMVGGLEPGPQRDRAAIEALVAYANERPGCLALLLSAVGPHADSVAGERLEPAKRRMLVAFGPCGPDDTNRGVRVAAALGALSVTSLVINQHGEMTPDLQTLVAGAAYDALGHDQPKSSKEN